MRLFGNTDRKEGFPIFLFVFYLLFYSGQSIYNTYLNLYLDANGLTYSQIGVIVSVSTIFLLLAQMGWGILSDRSKYKNRVVSLLLALTIISALSFYINSSFLFLALAVTMFSVFFNPIVPLLDNYTMEYIEGRRWDYGHLRMGGTIGYCITVLTVGFVIDESYSVIFYLVAFFLFLCFVISLCMPKIEGHRTEKTRSSFKELLNNKVLIGLILFNLAFSMGLNFFYNFYPIYFTSIGGNSSEIGSMMFFCAVTEIPMLLIIRKIVSRIGIRFTLILAGIVTTVRWILLYTISDPSVAIFVNLLHGFGYTSFSYCIITYISKSVPRDLRATGQMANALIGTVGSKVIFGYVGGIASEAIGANQMLLFSAALMGISTLIFFVWGSGKRELDRSVVTC